MAETTTKREPVLNEQDRGSASWQKLKAHLEARLKTLRVKNDGPNDERKTAQLRGSIGELKYLISLGDEKPLAPPDESMFKD